MNQRGFSLAELAITLTIIAFLLVGVLKGQSLIMGAKAKDVIAIVGDLRVATERFRERYKYLPGDWPYLNANEIPGITAGPSVGNPGDGIVDGTISAPDLADTDSEVAALPLQLFQAGFISKINASDPQRRLVTSFGAVHVVSSQAANGLISGPSSPNALPAQARNAIVFYNLPCDLVIEVDGSIDDGNILTGRARGSACTNGSVQWFAVVL